MGTSVLRRGLALGVLIASIAAIGIVLLGPGGAPYELRARFQNASQLVDGNSVQVAGVPIGSVTDIALTRDGQAEVTMEITDDGYVPLPRGVRAVVRQASLSGVANRYVDLQMPPGEPAGQLEDGALIRADSTRSAVDLDQLFNTFDRRTRRGLSNVIRGFAEQYEGEGRRANAGLEYLDPSLAAGARLFREINRDTPTLRRFVSANARLTTDLAASRDDVAGVVRNLEGALGALAGRRRELGQAIELLPDFMRRSNSTFVNLRATLDDLEPLVDASRPAARELRPFLAELRPLARDARPTLRDLVRLIRRDGARNDLIELTRSQGPLRDIAIGPVLRNGAQREGAFPASAKALGEAAPELATARPYAPDLTGWFDDFSHPGLYDALGAASRAAPHVNLFAAAQGVFAPLLTEDARQAAFSTGTTTRQTWRCPGAIERGALWKPSPDFPCDETQGPLGR